MRYYENLFIVNPGYEGDALEGIKNEYASLITDNGGKLYNVEDWGKRRLAYQIEKQKYGIYVLLEFGAEGSLIRELEESQRLNDSVLNFLTVRMDSEPDLSKERKRYIEEQKSSADSDEEDEEVEKVEEEELEAAAEEVEEEDEEEGEEEPAEEADEEVEPKPEETEATAEEPKDGGEEDDAEAAEEDEEEDQDSEKE